MKLPIGRNRGSKPPPPADMTLVGHLSELRSRLIKSVIAILVGAVIVYVFNEPIFDFLSEPYCEREAAEGAAVEGAAVEGEAVEGEDCKFLIRSPLESFSVVLSITGYGGLLLALPVILYQMAKFVLPGLYPEERKALLPFVAASVVLLVLGTISGYLLMPKTLDVLLSFGSENFVAFFSPKEYISFLVKMLLAFGIAAELPLVLVFLQLVGVVQTGTLKKNRRLAMVAVVILSAVVTPTGDPFTLAVLAVPMYLFYEIAVVVGGRLTRHRRAPVG
jgi:sec-independent protein translocase protein TatC